MQDGDEYMILSTIASIPHMKAGDANSAFQRFRKMSNGSLNRIPSSSDIANDRKELRKLITGRVVK